jgi:hypothetical protein
MNGVAALRVRFGRYMACTPEPGKWEVRTA